tara:strand:- start:2688 stop:3659 length:972 start_codon:yes stop_codon:yes gene_type:complete
MDKLKLLDTFAGIGGFSYAAEKLVGGFKTVQFIEIDSYCQQILNKNFPNIPIHDDISTYTAEPYSASVISSGFPCQDISVAGRQQGITEATRSGLFFQLLRTIRMVRPKYVILENVSAILNNGMDIVLGELYKAGYDAEWCCIPSSFVGACHQRDRIWIIAYPISFRSRSQSEIQTGRDSSSSCGGSGDVADSNSDNSQTRSQQLQQQEQTIISSINPSNTKSSDWDGDETQQGDGKPRTQEISRDRNSSQSSHTWRSTEHRLNPNWREYVSQPTICRGDDGLSTKLDAKQRVQRLKMLGNSIVPQVAAIPLQRVIQLEREQQ